MEGKAPDGLPRHPNGRPDFSKMPWGELPAYDAHRLKRAMLLAYIGDQARQADDFLDWGLNPVQSNRAVGPRWMTMRSRWTTRQT